MVLGFVEHKSIQCKKCGSKRHIAVTCKGGKVPKSYSKVNVLQENRVSNRSVLQENEGVLNSTVTETNWDCM